MASSWERRANVDSTRPHLEKSAPCTVSAKSLDPAPRRSMWRCAMFLAVSLANKSFNAWLECVTRRIFWEGKLWYKFEMICTAVSVLPVPGGPTINVRP